MDAGLRAECNSQPKKKNTCTPLNFLESMEWKYWYTRGKMNEWKTEMQNNIYIERNDD